MRARWIAVMAVATTFASVAAVRSVTRGDRGGNAAEAAFASYGTGLTRLDTALNHLDSALASGDLTASRAAFRRARSAYKRVELFVEYYGGDVTRELNGVPMPKAEDEDPEHPLAPVGLQMVEAALFPGDDPAKITGARKYVPYMRSAIGVLRRMGTDTMPGEAYLFDAMRHELARVATLGIAGFDATVSGDGIIEAADALEGVRGTIHPYSGRLTQADRARVDAFDSTLARSIRYLRSNADFDRFDRLAFITTYAVPAAHELAHVQSALRIGSPPKPRAWSARAASIYDRDAFDPGFFAATDAPAPSPALVSLGRDLFFDPSLSPAGTRSCASCHVPARAFTDGRARARLLPAHRVGSRSRNTPTLINAALQPVLFADERVRTLEDQATDVLGSASEMGGSLPAATEAVRRRPGYADRFADVFGGTPDRALTGRTLRLALAAYVRSLVALDSRFDRAVRADSMALSVEERRGLNLFMGKAKCGTCHFAPLFSGATPPALVESEPEVIGVPARSARRGARIDPDSGRFNIRRIDQHLHAFKTPTLRNVVLTAPYMHNGVFRTLDEVIDFYDVGGGHGVGATLAHQTLPPDSLHLERTEKRAIIAFLRTLTDTVIRVTPPAPPLNRVRR